MLLFPTDPNDIQKVCEDDFQLRCTITKFLTWGLLTVLITWEFLQFLSKILTSELDEYFSWQNMIELLMLNLSIAFFVIQYLESSDAEKSGRQEHLLGWALFLAWIDLTMFLGRFDLFGRHIYRSWHVMKNVAWSMTVYIPVLMAFATAFHCFLKNDEIFEGTVASILKVLTMVLGEFDFTDHFVYDKVKENHGSNFSVQIMFVMFIIYGSMIIVNLITAWIVVNQRDAQDTEVILAMQRIEEISGMTNLFGYCKGNQKEESKKNSNVPSTLKIAISSDEKPEDYSCFKIKYRNFLKWMNDDSLDAQVKKASTLWKIKATHLSKGDADDLNKKLPLFAPIDLIDLTVKRLLIKREKRFELMRSIKEIQKETNDKVEQLLGNEEKGGRITCQKCLH